MYNGLGNDQIPSFLLHHDVLFKCLVEKITRRLGTKNSLLNDTQFSAHDPLPSTGTDSSVWRQNDVVLYLDYCYYLYTLIFKSLFHCLRTDRVTSFKSKALKNNRNVS